MQGGVCLYDCQVLIMITPDTHMHLTRCRYLVVSGSTEDHGDIRFALRGHSGLLAFYKGGCLRPRSVKEGMRDLLTNTHTHTNSGFVGLPCIQRSWHKHGTWTATSAVDK